VSVSHAPIAKIPLPANDLHHAKIIPIVPIVSLGYLPKNASHAASQLPAWAVRATFLSKIAIGIMIVLYANVVEVRLLAAVFSPKEPKFFVRIVANVNNTIIQHRARWTPTLIITNIVVLLATFTRPIENNIQTFFSNWLALVCL
jgi:hypothetical protein